MNRCRRCNRELSDPNAMYGWRCAEILGVSETLSKMGDDVFDKFMDGVIKAQSLLGEDNSEFSERQRKSLYSAYAKMSLWDGVDDKKVNEAKKERFSIFSSGKAKAKSFADELDEYKDYIEKQGVASGTSRTSEKTKRNNLDSLSNLLAAASLIPGFDSITNLASIPVDLARGDFDSAGLSALGALPFVGEFADIGKYADKGIDVVRIVDKASDTSKAAKKSKNIINKQKRGTPRNNRAQNKQTNSVSKKLKLSPKQQRELHDLISGQNWGYQEILENAKEWFNK